MSALHTGYSYMCECSIGFPSAPHAKVPQGKSRAQWNGGEMLQQWLWRTRKMHGQQILHAMLEGSMLDCNGACSEHAKASMMRAERACMDREALAGQGEAARSRAFTIFSLSLI